MRSQLRGVVAHISSSVFLVAVGLCALGSSCSSAASIEEAARHSASAKGF